MSLNLSYRALYKALSSAVILAVLAATIYVFYEPVATHAQDSQTFTVTQDITGEISLTLSTTTVIMVGPIAGLTGGAATGSISAIVTTNDPDGYNMTIEFPYATTTGMDGNNTAAYINHYSPAVAGTPDYAWVDNSTGGAAEFGYTVSASTSADLGLVFQDDGGGNCGGGGNDTTAYSCWLNGTNTPITITNRTSGSATNATTTIVFRVNVPNNPSPTIDIDTYTATATLTATNN